MLGFPTGPGYAWCVGGFHIASLNNLTSREGGLYCASHMPKDEPDNRPDPAGDPPHIGKCCVARCAGEKPVWLVPNDQRWYCVKHLRVIVDRAAWRP